MTIHLCHRCRQRGLPRLYAPRAVPAALVCAVVCLVSAMAPAAVTYAHKLYGDKIESIWKNASWRAHVDTDHKTRVYNGACSMEVTLKGKGALCFSYEKGWNLRRYSALVGWIHGGSEGAQNVRVALRDTEGTVLPTKRGVRLATAAHVEGGRISARRWQFFVIPVGELKPGYKDIARIVFYNPSEKTMPTFYLDDVGFTAQRVPLFSEGKSENEKPVERPRRTSHAIYTDSLKNGWENWSWNTSVELDNQDGPAQGKRAILVEQKPGGGLGFGRQGAFPTAGYRAIEFYINGGDTGGQTLNVSVFDENDQIIATVKVNNTAYINGGTVSPNLWQQVYIPLRDLRATSIGVRKIGIVNAGTGDALYYVDAVSLVK